MEKSKTQLVAHPVSPMTVAMAQPPAPRCAATRKFPSLATVPAAAPPHGLGASRIAPSTIPTAHPVAACAGVGRRASSRPDADTAALCGGNSPFAGNGPLAPTHPMEPPHALRILRGLHGVLAAKATLATGHCIWMLAFASSRLRNQFYIPNDTRGLGHPDAILL